MKRVLVLFLLFAACLEFDSGAAEANDPRSTQLTYAPWAKLCFMRADGNSDCFISAAARGACHPSGGGVSIAIRDEKTLNLLVNFATRTTLGGGISIQIDRDIPILIPHADCFGLGCRGQLKIDSTIIERLKRGQTITVEATNTAHQKLGLSFSLADFAAAYDGPAADPPKLHEEIVTTDKMKDLMKQAEEQKKGFACDD